MNISFVTSNKHKYEEVKNILSEFGIEAEQKDIELPEPEGDIDSIAKAKAKHAAGMLMTPVCVDDTGIFFEAYKNFPGPNPKFVFNGIGYEGIMRLLKGKSRKAYFRTAVSYCEPGNDPIVFDGVMKGKITEEVHDEEKDVLPYMRIFIADGQEKVISSVPVEEKNRISHRGQAFRKLGRFLKERYK
ncbi:RdgB/HAM1 family non-canonical purine NTP pyrophosphatase [Candidatus Woesearchaeota archaeon]|nr:RdgB/HAM1 family non-canonical purine NTP pyrophosphatase [Candidatus Woesearchaeota archaeon]